jgi:hypothetical protein
MLSVTVHGSVSKLPKRTTMHSLATSQPTAGKLGHSKGIEFGSTQVCRGVWQSGIVRR